MNSHSTNCPVTGKYLFIYLYCVLTLFDAARSSSANELLIVVASILPIVETRLQLVLMRKIPGNKENSLSASIDIWILPSCAILLFDTFIAKDFDTNIFQTKVYRSCSDILGDIIIPLDMVFARIKATVYHHNFGHFNLWRSLYSSTFGNDFSSTCVSEFCEL